MDWKQLLAYITGSVDQELLVRNEYRVTENRILRQQITGYVRLSDGERCFRGSSCLVNTPCATPSRSTTRIIIQNAPTRGKATSSCCAQRP
jgi:hypothetical protein